MGVIAKLRISDSPVGCNLIAARPAPRDIGRMVSIPHVLRQLGWPIRHRKRADCGLCRGNSTGTVAFTEHLWKCHRCNGGGDVFSLVRAANHCGFPEALRVVAQLAGIRLEDRRNADFQRQLGARKRQRARVEGAAVKLEAWERKLRLECRDRIHDTERKQQQVSARLAEIQRGEPKRFRGEQDGLWMKLKAAAVLRETDLPTYTLLSFADPAERARFVLYPELRDEMIADVRWAGYIRTADGKQIEVLA